MVSRGLPHQWRFYCDTCRIQSHNSCFLLLPFLVNSVEKAPTKKERRRRKAKRREREKSDQIKFISLRFEIWQVVKRMKARRRQDVP